MSTNEITGDKQQTKPVTDAYRENYDKIFGKKKCQDTLNTNHAQAVDKKKTSIDNSPKEESLFIEMCRKITENNATE